MNSKNLYPMLINLQLFAEGGGAAAGAGAGDGGTGAEGTQGVTAAAAMSQRKGAKTNPLENVVYGKQPAAATEETAPAAEVQTETAAQPDRNAEFEKLIKGEYKDPFDARVQDIIQKRLKGMKEQVEKFNALTPTLELLAQKYGVDAGDIEALNAAIQEDDAYYEQEALEKGVTVQQLKEIRRMERENAELRQMMQQQEKEESNKRIYAQWMREAEETKAIYPTFDMDVEMQNKDFVQLLGARVPVRAAYEVVHKDEIIGGAMQFAAQAVEQKITNKIKANGARPTEGGMGAQSAAVVKSDVSQLSKADLHEIQRRVARGEKISF